MSNKIIILTGEIQTGKTTLLQQFCKGRNDIAGILTPVVNGRRMFYDIAENYFFEMEAATDEAALAIGKYLFSATAFEKANNILLKAVKRNDISYLLIDEIGPLELIHQKGLYESLITILRSVANYTLIIVVRQSLVEQVVKKYNLGNANPMGIAEMKAYFEAPL